MSLFHPLDLVLSMATLLYGPLSSIELIFFSSALICSLPCQVYRIYWLIVLISFRPSLFHPCFPSVV